MDSQTKSELKQMREYIADIEHTIKRQQLMLNTVEASIAIINAAIMSKALILSEHQGFIDSIMTEDEEGQESDE